MMGDTDIDWLKSVINDDDLGLLTIKQVTSAPTADEHLIAKFNEINDFITRTGKAPEANRSNMPEFMLHKRLQAIRNDEKQSQALASVDTHKLLPVRIPDVVNEPPPEYSAKPKEINSFDDFFDDDSLGLLADTESNKNNDIFTLKHVSTERAQPEKIEKRKACKDFSKYEAQFKKVQQEIKMGERKLRVFNDKGESLVAGCYYILSGVLLFLESIDISSPEKTIKGKRFRKDGRTRCIFENGTQSNMLYRSLAKALYIDGKIVVDTNADTQQYFSENMGVITDEDAATGFIYVLSSLSTSPDIQRINNLYKIGFAGDSIEKRIANAENEATYLMAPVKYEAGYQCYNMNAQKLESLLHTFFGDACLKIEIADAKGKPCQPREWFIAPMTVIEQVIELIVSGEVVNYSYDEIREKIVEKS